MTGEVSESDSGVGGFFLFLFFGSCHIFGVFCLQVRTRLASDISYLLAFSMLPWEQEDKMMEGVYFCSWLVGVDGILWRVFG